MRSQAICLALLTCSFAAGAKSRTPKLFGIPTQYKTSSGFTFGASGVYQYDWNDFSGGGIDPSTGQPLFEDAHTWARRELDAYFKAPNGLELHVGYDWSKSWADNYLKYSSKKFGDFRVGQFLTQVGWESVEGAQTWTFLTPSLPGTAVFEGRRIGADWSYAGIDHWLFQVAYLWNGNLDGKFPGHTYSARIVFDPIEREDSVLHLGLAASREIPGDHVAHFFSPPEASLTRTNLVDTKVLPFTDSIDRRGLEVGYLRGPVYMQGEYLVMTAHRTSGLPDFRGHGFYVQGAWMLNGGTARSYKDGEFSMPKSREWNGDFELAARYSELDLRDGIVEGGREHNWTVGVNWYWKSLELQADYVWAHANDSPANLYVAAIDPRVFEVRLQIYFGP